jgi:hypothetical protein
VFAIYKSPIRLPVDLPLPPQSRALDGSLASVSAQNPSGLTGHKNLASGGGGGGRLGSGGSMTWPPGIRLENKGASRLGVFSRLPV